MCYGYTQTDMSHDAHILTAITMIRIHTPIKNNKLEGELVGYMMILASKEYNV